MPRLDKQQGSFLLAVLAFVFAAMAFGVQCQNSYRTSLWREQCDQERRAQDLLETQNKANLTKAINEFSATIKSWIH